ncbi:DUF4214 domain-containing protein [Stutzerimonas stutzeri]|uniref:DUF4214 domain-containing protein n=1 Tax=Stutzerimonas stutzeri TaxID=316 RepID=UPI00210EAEDF|nr:DUF4214 domain-containing protein [Stutzerimonas stutzeri]MCQ4322418.1 DUF4214 domain-containing protein [Stutzerimonas stutzeri]
MKAHGSQSTRYHDASIRHVALVSIVNQEVTELSVYPYRAVAHLYVTFPDGSAALGTGALVGRNDLLTATHVLYDPDAGGWATDIRIALGVDYNTSSYRYESASLIDLEGVRWSALGFPAETFQDSNNDTLTLVESQADVALIGLSQAVGDQLGYFDLAPGYDTTQLAYQIGYPEGSTGMMYGALLVQSLSRYEVYQATQGGANELMGPGSSGGPLFVFDNEVPTIIGVRSSYSATEAYWADVGYTYEQLVAAISANDELLGEWVATNTLHGTAANDVLYATAQADAVLAGTGLDVLVFASERRDYSVAIGSSGAVVSRHNAAGDIDHLSGVERLKFSDGVLAVDVGAGEAAGSAYRLYQAAFDRQPDIGGLNYWIDRIDAGLTLQEAASGFVHSAEFESLYGAELSNDALITQYYVNVLHREPDPAGYAYWVGEMAAGLSGAEVLASFSESTENQVKVSGALDEGIWLA